MTKHIEGQVASHLATKERLLEIAGVYKWRPEDIEAHKAKELAAAPPATKYFAVLQYAPLILGALLFLVIAIGVVSAFTSPSIFAVALIAFVAIWILDSKIENVVLRGPARWVRMDLIQYVHKYGSIPEEGFNIYSAALTLLRDAHFTVDVLMQDKVRLDPVLYLNGTPIFVWDKDGKTVLPPAD